MILILIWIALLGNIELQRPFKLIITNTTASLVDYHVTWWFIPSCFLGAADFETILTTNHAPYLRNGTACGLLLGLFLAAGMTSWKNRALGLLLLAPFAYSTVHFMQIVGHYHVIRLSEFVGTLCLCLSAAGFFLFWQNTKT